MRLRDNLGRLVVIIPLNTHRHTNSAGTHFDLIADVIVVDGPEAGTVHPLNLICAGFVRQMIHNNSRHPKIGRVSKAADGKWILIAPSQDELAQAELVMQEVEAL